MTFRKKIQLTRRINIDIAVFAILLKAAFGLIILGIVFPPVLSAQLGPGPGDVYREYTKVPSGDKWRVTDPAAGASGAKEFLPNPVLQFQIDDLQGAVRVEAVLDRWGGHPGTSGKKVRFNGNDWIKVPELTTTPEGQLSICYMYQDNPVFEVPLTHLQEGINTFEGTCKEQVCYSFDWGQWGWYGLILRVYYDSSKAHPEGRITSPAPGEILSENPLVKAVATSEAGIERIVFLAWSEGYDVDGDGIYTEWQSRYDGTSLTDHLGTDSAWPYRATWNTEWIPDQPEGVIKIVARIKDRNGYWFVTDAVEGLTLKRDTTSVRLYPAHSVPRKFWVRANSRSSCKINIPESEVLSLALEAAVHLRTWNGINEKFVLNDRWQHDIAGDNHRFRYSIRQVSPEKLVHGDNKVSFTSTTEHHGVEILWPGPALTVRYRLFTEDMVTCDFNGDGTVSLEDLVSFLLLGHRHPNDPRVDWNRDGRHEINDAVLLLRNILEGTCPGSGPGLATASGWKRRVEKGKVSREEVEYLEKTLMELPLSDSLRTALERLIRSLETDSKGSPRSIDLLQNSPNPFNPVTAITYYLPPGWGDNLRVKLGIYNLRGSLVRALMDGPRQSGTNTFYWDGTDSGGRQVPNGVYLYRLEAGGEVLTRKMVLLK